MIWEGEGGVGGWAGRPRGGGVAELSPRPLMGRAVGGT